LKWRRRYIEAYLIWPDAIAVAAGIDVDVVKSDLDSVFGFGTIGQAWTKSDAADTFLDARAKAILEHFRVKAVKVAQNLPSDAICEDIRTFFAELAVLSA
jgi:hypothetical protein